MSEFRVDYPQHAEYHRYAAGDINHVAQHFVPRKRFRFLGSGQRKLEQGEKDKATEQYCGRVNVDLPGQRRPPGKSRRMRRRKERYITAAQPAMLAATRSRR